MASRARNGTDVVFFVGMPRSGTTICFETFARHPALAWPSNYTEAYPGWPALNVLRRLLDNRLISAYGAKNQYGTQGWLNTYLPQPNEAYNFWDRYARPTFSRDWLSGVEATDRERRRLRRQVAKIVAWQGRQRFTAKLTGPPRMRYLASVFPEARFVHVIRDGRAVVDSLLRVAFWRNKGGLEQPFWDGAIAPDELQRWREEGSDPGLLTAIQWRHVIQTARAEAAALPADRYCEIRYEELVADSHRVVRDLFAFCGLSDAPRAHRQIDNGVELANMNHKFLENFEPAYLARVEAAIGDDLCQLGYAVPAVGEMTGVGNA